MTPPRSLRRSALVLAALMLVSGCDSGDDQSDSSEEVSDQPTSGAQAPRGWEVIRDEEAEVEFALPMAVDAMEQEQNGVTTRLYQVETGEVAVGVTVVTADEPFPPNAAKGTLGQLVAGLSAAGADDAELTDVRRSRIAGVAGLNATLEFTAGNGSRNYWRMRVISTDSRLIQLQALTFTEDPAKEPAAQRKVDAAFARLARSVTVS